MEFVILMKVLWIKKLCWNPGLKIRERQDFDLNSDGNCWKLDSGQFMLKVLIPEKVLIRDSEDEDSEMAIF